VRVSLVMTSRGMGGIQQSLVPYALALKAGNHAVQIVVRRGADILGEVLERGLAEDTWVLGGRWNFLRPLETRELRRKLLEFRPDIVVGFAQKGLFEALRAMRGREVPVVTRVGTMRAKRQRRFHGADGWLATTAEMKQALTGLGFPTERVFVVPNFLADPVAPGCEKTVDGVPRIGAMGRFAHRKGFHVLIEAAALLKRRGVRFACDIAGEGRARRELARQIEAFGVGDRVRLLGWLDNESKAKFVAGLQLFICPSLDEPFGFVHLEAMRQGKPVITAPTVGARHIFGDGDGAVFVPFADAAALADAVERLLVDAPQRAALGARATAICRKHFNLEAGTRNLGDALAALRAVGRR
jgi:glycosyltransferase involved in cell wall biosynthesis